MTPDEADAHWRVVLRKRKDREERFLAEAMAKHDLAIDERFAKADEVVRTLASLGVKHSRRGHYNHIHKFSVGDRSVLVRNARIIMRRGNLEREVDEVREFDAGEAVLFLLPFRGMKTRLRESSFRSLGELLS